MPKTGLAENLVRQGSRAHRASETCRSNVPCRLYHDFHACPTRRQAPCCHNALTQCAAFNRNHQLLASVTPGKEWHQRPPTTANANSELFSALLAKSVRDVGQSRCFKPDRAGKDDSTWRSQNGRLCVSRLIFPPSFSLICLQSCSRDTIPIP